MKVKKSVIILLLVFIFCTSFIIWFWPVRNDDYTEITNQELPSDVRNKFKEVYNYKEPPKISSKGDTLWYSPPFVECYNMNKDCPCKIESKGGIIRDAFFVFTSCTKTKKISWGILQRVFIIKNDSIYYPWSTTAVTETGESRSTLIKIDTLKFRVEKM